MRRQRTFENCSDSILRHLHNDEEGQISSNNFMNSGQSQTSDLQKLSSSIICSANITRKSLLQGPNVMRRSNYDSNTVDDNDDDDEFFTKIKINIDRNLLQNSKENDKPNSIQQDIFSLRRRRPIIDEETQNVIKRFKKDANIDHTNFMQTPTNNISTTQSKSSFNNIGRHPYEVPRNINGIENIMKQQNTKRCPMYNLLSNTNNVGNIVRQKNTISSPMYNFASTNDGGNIIKQKDTINCSYNLPTSTNDVGPTVIQENTTNCTCNLPTSTNAVGNIMKPQTIFTSNDVHTRNSNKYMFKMCSKIRKNKILPLNENQTAVIRTECKKVLYYAATYFTPPRRNSSECD
ncbi:uncharacterized protein LOC143355557 [Halictus rubicundus]|uniref:uncharacterized protein LOC143355557 n=1 Tax=Halictus rubicundus TaxID=77578 RepID=UPI0040359EFB